MEYATLRSLPANLRLPEHRAPTYRDRPRYRPSALVKAIMKRRYDVIVVGARCAGAPTAMLLARNGYKVLLVDRSRFPSEIPHGHFIHRHGPRRLRGWGLLSRLIAAGCPPSTTITMDTGDICLVGGDLVVDGIAAGYGPRRAVLDMVLVEAAIEAGAELRESFAVEEYLTEENRVVGVRGRDCVHGARVTEYAAITVGADGRGSLLARTVRAPKYEFVPTLMCWYFSYWSGDLPGLELYVRGKRAIFAHPTNNGLFAVFVGFPIQEQRPVQSDLERQFMAAVDLAPNLADRVRSGERAERFYGAANLPNFLRTPLGPGWALVGDASCHKDPYLALGICDAFRDAELVADAVDQQLSGARRHDQAMADYERRRNEATIADYRMNLDLAQFKPLPAEQRRLMEAVQGNQEATNRFLMAREGMIAPETFFQCGKPSRIDARVEA
jgi:flavin-dependent dehydrogenase